MNLTDRKDLIFNCAKDAFHRVLRLNLEEGLYTDILHDVDDDNTEGRLSFADFTEHFVKNHAENGKDRLAQALSLDTIKDELGKNGRYVVFGGSAKQSKAGYKMLSFIAEADTRYATIYCTDFTNIAVYYNGKLSTLKDDNYRDRLTSAFNRNYYEQKLRERRMSGSLAMIDIDDFKLCNDTYGHEIGDFALTETARIILKNIRERDMLIRLGGDEFLLILPDCPAERMTGVLERIRKEVNDSESLAFGNFHISLSIGGVAFNEETVAEAAYRADRIMYLAKKQKNTLMTEEQMAESGADRETEKTDRQKLLIVDDSDFNRRLLSELLEDSFDIIEAADGKECMAVLKHLKTQISLVLLDVIMPVMDGFSVLKEMTEEHLLEDIPVIMISADAGNANIRRALEMGAADYIHRPFDAKIVKQRIQNTVKLHARQRRMLSVLIEQIREKEADSRIMADILSNVIAYLNKESTEHIRSLKKLTAMLLERLILKTDRYSLSWKDCEIISTAAMLHDIGKLEIEPEIRSKHGKLTKEEDEFMKTHTLRGEQILKDEKLTIHENEPLLKYAVQICRWHHERFDGGGYPDGLEGENIPIAAQVVGLADAYDALIGGQDSQKAYEPDEAVQILKKGECGSFNPVLIECLSEIVEKLITAETFI